MSSADSHTISASSRGRHCATSASTFSTSSTRLSGCRGTTGSAQCTTARGARTAPDRGGAATCGISLGRSTQSPHRSACVTHDTTTPARAAATRCASAPGRATHPLRGRIRRSWSTAARTERSLHPLSRRWRTRTTPPARRRSSSIPMPPLWPDRSRTPRAPGASVDDRLESPLCGGGGAVGCRGDDGIRGADPRVLAAGSAASSASDTSPPGPRR